MFSALALAQYALLRKDLPSRATASAPARLVALWRREAKPLIVVVLVTYLFADIAILMVTPLLPSAGTAVIGLCLKLALLVGFAVQVAHHVVVPDLADARARKDPSAVGEAAFRALPFPLAATLAAMVAVALWGETLLALFGPEFAGAKLPLLILMACQLARALFGPSVPLADGDRRAKGECRARHCHARRACRQRLAAGAALWRAWRRHRGRGRDPVLAGGLGGRVDAPQRAPHRRPLSAWQAWLPAQGGGLARAAGERDRPGLVELLLGLLGGEQRGENEPSHEGGDGQEGDGRANFAEM